MIYYFSNMFIILNKFYSIFSDAYEVANCCTVTNSNADSSALVAIVMKTVITNSKLCNALVS